MAAPIAALPNEDVENDDQYDDVSYTTSIASSITDYKFEHGRRYHAYKEGRYLLPNDEAEQDRMDLQYHALRLAFGDKMIFAPVSEKLGRVLDAGTGTGPQLMQTIKADAYPDAEVFRLRSSPSKKLALTNSQIYGIDLSPIQSRFSAPNVKYQVDDLEQPWTFPLDHFDYVHTRILYGSLRDWPLFFAQSFKHLRPGGHLECQEIAVDARADDGTLPADSAITAWCRNQEEAMQKAGGMTLLATGEKLKAMMEEAGFVDVVAKEFKIPIGQWPADEKMRETGTLQLVAMLEGIGGLTMALWTRFLGWEREDVEDELAKVRAEWQRKDIHSYWPAYVYAVYGRKPLEGKTG
ncbi:MAG: hypothetical protein LQ341_004980 [Variospora aurantia]|nr:MAG: hypothetical protein LQ341_004980 [Variospora aurantia]